MRRHQPPVAALVHHVALPHQMQVIAPKQLRPQAQRHSRHDPSPLKEGVFLGIGVAVPVMQVFEGQRLPFFKGVRSSHQRRQLARGHRSHRKRLRGVRWRLQCACQRIRAEFTIEQHGIAHRQLPIPPPESRQIGRLGRQQGSRPTIAALIKFRQPAIAPDVAPLVWQQTALTRAIDIHQHGSALHVRRPRKFCRVHADQLAHRVAAPVIEVERAGRRAKLRRPPVQHIAPDGRTPLFSQAQARLPLAQIGFATLLRRVVTVQLTSPRNDTTGESERFAFGLEVGPQFERFATCRQLRHPIAGIQDAIEIHTG